MQGVNAFMRSSEQGDDEVGRRRASGSEASSINYSETMDHELIAQQMNGHLNAIPIKYYDNQQSLPDDAVM